MGEIKINKRFWILIIKSTLKKITSKQFSSTFLMLGTIILISTNLINQSFLTNENAEGIKLQNTYSKSIELSLFPLKAWLPSEHFFFRLKKTPDDNLLYDATRIGKEWNEILSSQLKRDQYRNKYHLKIYSDKKPHTISDKSFFIREEKDKEIRKKRGFTTSLYYKILRSDLNKRDKKEKLREIYKIFNLWLEPYIVDSLNHKIKMLQEKECSSEKIPETETKKCLLENLNYSQNSKSNSNKKGYWNIFHDEEHSRWEPILSKRGKFGVVDTTYLTKKVSTTSLYFSPFTKLTSIILALEKIDFRTTLSITLSNTAFSLTNQKNKSILTSKKNQILKIIMLPRKRNRSMYSPEMQKKLISVIGTLPRQNEAMLDLPTILSTNLVDRLINSSLIHVNINDTQFALVGGVEEDLVSSSLSSILTNQKISQLYVWKKYLFEPNIYQKIEEPGGGIEASFLFKKSENEEKIKSLFTKLQTIRLQESYISMIKQDKYLETKHKKIKTNSQNIEKMEKYYLSKVKGKPGFKIFPPSLEESTATRKIRNFLFLKNSLQQLLISLTVIVNLLGLIIIRERMKQAEKTIKDKGVIIWQISGIKYSREIILILFFNLFILLFQGFCSFFFLTLELLIPSLDPLSDWVIKKRFWNLHLIIANIFLIILYQGFTAITIWKNKTKFQV